MSSGFFHSKEREVEKVEAMEKGRAQAVHWGSVDRGS